MGLFSSTYDEVAAPAGTASARLAAQATAMMNAACPPWRDVIRTYVAEKAEQGIPTGAGSTWAARHGGPADRRIDVRKAGRADRATGVSLLTGNPEILLEIAMRSGAAAGSAVSAADLEAVLRALNLNPFIVSGPDAATAPRTHVMPYERTGRHRPQSRDAHPFHWPERTAIGNGELPELTLLEGYVLDAAEMLLADDIADATDITGARSDIASLLAEGARLASAGRQVEQALTAARRAMRADNMPDDMRHELGLRVAELDDTSKASKAAAARQVAQIIAASSIYQQLRTGHSAMIERATEETGSRLAGAAALDAADKALGMATATLADFETARTRTPAAPTAALATTSGTTPADTPIELPNIDAIEVSLYSGMSTRQIEALMDALRQGTPGMSNEAAARAAYHVILDADAVNWNSAWLYTNFERLIASARAGVDATELVAYANVAHFSGPHAEMAEQVYQKLRRDPSRHSDVERHTGSSRPIATLELLVSTTVAWACEQSPTPSVDVLADALAATLRTAPLFDNDSQLIARAGAQLRERIATQIPDAPGRDSQARPVHVTRTDTGDRGRQAPEQAP